MRVYVAASSAELGRARKWMDALRAEGIAVTSTWVEIIESVGDANPRDASREQRQTWSKEDLHQVYHATHLWVLAPKIPTRGAWIEFGFAVARDLHILTSGDTKQSIFCALGEEVDTDEEAFELLRRWNQGETPFAKTAKP